MKAILIALGILLSTCLVIIAYAMVMDYINH